MKNIIGQLKNGEKVIVWGLASEPKTGTTQTGKVYTNFSVSIGKDDQGEKIYMKIQAWEKLAKQFASLIDKRDLVFVVGTCRRDDYWSERNQKEEFVVTAEFMTTQQYFGGEAGKSSVDDDDPMNLP